MKTILVRFLLVICVILMGSAAAARAEDLATVRARMEKRIPRIHELKASGALGENNQGFLVVRVKGEADSLAADEDADRKTVFAAIAAQTGTTPDQVGKARAKRIAERSPPGTWLQHDDGSWYQK